MRPSLPAVFTATIGAAILLLAAPTGRAEDADGELAVGRQVPLILKLLAYENNLMNLHRQTIRIGVLYLPHDPDSRRTFEQFRREMKRDEHRTIHNRRLVVVPLPVGDANSVGPALRGASIDVVYVTMGFDAGLGSVIATTREENVLSVTGVPAYVEMGLSVAVVLRGDQPGITLNLEASREEGRDWNAYLLDLCRIIR
jgi:hypothetical protein